MTPLDYLTDIRIENAKRLLSDIHRTGISVSDVGAMCGYYDAGYFCRIFKRKTGYTPRQFHALRADASDNIGDNE